MNGRIPRRGDVVIPSAAAVALGFHPTPRRLRRRSLWSKAKCRCCGAEIAQGDLYSSLEVISPLCAACTEPYFPPAPE